MSAFARRAGALILLLSACQAQPTEKAPSGGEEKVDAPNVPETPKVDEDTKAEAAEDDPMAVDLDTPIDELAGEPLFKRVCVPPTPPPDDLPPDLVAQVYLQASKCRMAFTWIAEREPEIADSLARCGLKTRELEEPSEEKFIACLPEDHREDGKRLSMEAREAVEKMVEGAFADGEGKPPEPAPGKPEEP